MESGSNMQYVSDNSSVGEWFDQHKAAGVAGGACSAISTDSALTLTDCLQKKLSSHYKEPLCEFGNNKILIITIFIG